MMGRDDLPQDGEAHVPVEGSEEHERVTLESEESYQERRTSEEERLEVLLARVHALVGEPDPVVGKFEKGHSVLTACEEAIEVCIRDGVHPRDAWVEVPRGHVTVEFLLAALAVGGAA